ncbi:hypothetical protein HUG10_12945 [Halorarum halophilum]|uniref:Transposase n=1 Tax=Halorarum halophilum TaxID=2743090 RepID=A0A7D5KXK7_9EURY|nr:hypothetical protein [Halobaculum halophilum]QLG28398.1 hypothetical protein HUG10_12945 [Halobaculum halophilum]
MSPEARGRSETQESEEVYGGEDAPEVVRLRRENARLRHRVVTMERERDNLVARYEALLPDGAERDGDGTTNTRPSDDRAFWEDGSDADVTGRSRSDRGSVVAAIGRFLRDRLR